MQDRFKTCTPSQMTESEFVDTFADIYEHSAWIARQAFAQGLSSEQDTITGLHQLMQDVLLRSSRQAQLALIKAHPDLAGKAAIAGELTASSSQEQSGAGIDQCSAQELSTFNQLNSDYKRKFNFPFIMAVKASNKALILAAFKERIEHSIEREFQQALIEINKIALFRLNDL